MRKVRYSVAMSLDGFIAGPGGEFDWLPTDMDFDWGAFMARFDTVVMGRRTWDLVRTQGGASEGMRTYVISRTLDGAACPGATVSPDALGTVAALRREVGREIWLMGGGELFRDLLDAGLVDVVEVSVVPILLGGGIPFLPGLSRRVGLDLAETRSLGGGVVQMVYDVCR